MVGKKLWRMITAGVWGGLILILTGTIVSAQANIQGMVIDTVNARTGPGTDHAIITMISAQTKIAIEGRNQIGNWVLIHTFDNALRGWVATRYTAWDDGTPLDIIPVTTETLAAPASSPPPSDANPDENTNPAPATPVAAPAGGGITAQTLDTLKVRTGPDWESATLGNIAPRTTIIIEGRNPIGNWVLMHAADNSLRGWVATRYTIWDDKILLESLPVTTETLAAVTSNPSPASENPSANPQSTSAESTAVTTGGGITAQTLDTLKVRTGPDWESTTLGNIAPRAAIIIEGRNPIGNWVLMHATDNHLRGWVATRYTAWDETILLESIPVTTEEVGIPAPEVVMNNGDNTLSVSGTEAEMMNALAAIPVVPAISGNARAIYQRGQTMGNNPQNFTKIGDSNSASQAYLGLLGIGAYDLGKFRYLQATIDYYKGGSENSFTARTPTAQSGMVTTSMIDALFSDPSYCGEQSPLDCELGRSQPSIALIYLGAADNKLLTHDDYTNALRQIVESCINRGVIPVLTTMPTKPHYQQTQQRPLEFNMIIINIARQYDIPLINMWRAVRDLPEHGLQDDLLHFTYSGVDYLDFNGGQNQWGYTAWNLAVLETLDAIRKAMG